MICKCGNIIPTKRLEIGYSVCVNCSNEEQVAAIDIIYHKTGNTISTAPKSIANEFNKKAKRSGFGIMSGIRTAKTNHYNPKNVKFGCSTTQIGSKESFLSVRNQILEDMHTVDVDYAILTLEKAYKNTLINERQKNELYALIDVLKLSF